MTLKDYLKCLSLQLFYIEYYLTVSDLENTVKSSKKEYNFENYFCKSSAAVA